MLKRFTIFLILAVAFSALPTSVVPGGAGPVLAQNRRVMLEEMTGVWCGFCVRGALAIKMLDDQYPGQVVAVAIHGPLANAEPMATLQGDSLINGTGSANGPIGGYPDGWTARSGTKWDVNPGAWIDTNNETGIVENLLGTTTNAAVSIDKWAFDQNSQMVTATLSVKFLTAQTGDLRFNLYVAEDSVTGSGAPWAQHNYYYHSTLYGMGPYYNWGTGAAGNGTIPNYVYNHVFRQAVVGVWGLKGVIPASVKAGSTYTQDFSFPLPSNVSDWHHVNLIGFVHHYSATVGANNEIFDADQAPLFGAKPKILTTSITVNNTTKYVPAKAGGSATADVSFSNNGTDPVTLNLAIDPSLGLPAGWSATITPPQLNITASNVGNATITITAPQQSDFVTVKFSAIPFKEGYLAETYYGRSYFLSDNTKYALYEMPGAVPTPSVLKAVPATMKPLLATIPLNTDAVAAFPIETYDVAIFDNDPCLGGTWAAPADAATSIAALLDAGKKVYFASPTAMTYQYNASVQQYAASSSEDARALFEDRMGLSETATELRYNTSTGAYTSFKVQGVSSGPDGGVPAVPSITCTGTPYSDIFTINAGSGSVPAYYFDGKPANLAGVYYTDPTTHGKMVYLGFDLTLFPTASAKYADSVAQRAMRWLMATPNGGVADGTTAATSMLSALSNPFQGVTRVTYTAAAGERDVTLSAYDVLGREVAKLNPISAGDNSYSASFDARKLADGTYTIVAHTTKGTKEIKVVNQN